MKKFLFLFLLSFGALFASVVPLEHSANETHDLSEFESEFDEQVVSDPLRSYNEMMTKFNLKFYRYVARPVSKAYKAATPTQFRVSAKNFFSYLLTPMRLVNNLLQFKFKNAGNEVKRFAHNTIFGFFGLIDSASKAGIPKHQADFGTTLAHWGVGSGFHIVLPFLGPSNLRDSLSLPVSWYMSPTGYIEPFLLSVGISSYAIINDTSFEMQTYDEIFFNTPNVYPFLRDAYEKQRKALSE